jgi:hypothetical protein
MSGWMTNIVVGAAFGATVAMGIAVFGGVSSPEAVIQAQQSEEIEEPRITEDELELYIDVYRSMQDDRSLKIEEAVERKGITVAEFRAIERRVQLEERLIKRVREALLEQAKENAASLVERGVAARP